MTKRRKVGFTLVETIVIISILGILAVGGALGVNKQLSKARDTQRKLEIKNLAKALEEYYDSSLCYPQKLPDCGGKLYLGNSTMHDSIPCDPLTHEPYLYETDADPGCASFYKIYANLENKEDDAIAYLGCTFGCGPDCLYNYGVSSSNTRLDGCEPPISPTEQPISPPITEGPSPTGSSDQQYVCAPGIGNDGHCTVFEFPDYSECPMVWINDPSCDNKCGDKDYHCKNAKGKKPGQ